MDFLLLKLERFCADSKRLQENFIVVHTMHVKCHSFGWFFIVVKSLLPKFNNGCSTSYYSTEIEAENFIFNEILIPERHNNWVLVFRVELSPKTKQGRAHEAWLILLVFGDKKIHIRKCCILVDRYFSFYDICQN